jgi:hypothetical protein
MTSTVVIIVALFDVRFNTKNCFFPSIKVEFILELLYKPYGKDYDYEHKRRRPMYHGNPGKEHGMAA